MKVVRKSVSKAEWNWTLHAKEGLCPRCYSSYRPMCPNCGHSLSAEIRVGKKHQRITNCEVCDALVNLDDKGVADDSPLD